MVNDLPSEVESARYMGMGERELERGRGATNSSQVDSFDRRAWRHTETYNNIHWQEGSLKVSDFRHDRIHVLQSIEPPPGSTPRLRLRAAVWSHPAAAGGTATPQRNPWTLHVRHVYDTSTRRSLGKSSPLTLIRRILISYRYHRNYRTCLLLSTYTLFGCTTVKSFTRTHFISHPDITQVVRATPRAGA